MDDQHSQVGGVLVLALAARDVPRVADHELEVVVVVDARADVLVVVDELVEVDATAAVPVPDLGELLEGLVRGEESVDDVGVLGDVVDAHEVLHGDDAVAGLIQLSKGQLHETLAALVHLAAERPEELVEDDGAVTVLVEVEHDLLNLVPLHLDALVP